MTTQLHLPDIPASGAPPSRARHTFGLLSQQPAPTDLDPAGVALVDSCRSCGCLRRLANTGARMGAKRAWSLDGGKTWKDAAPPCFIKAK